MLFKKSFQKTKNFFLKTMQSLKNYLFGGYDKIPKILFLNPLSCSSINQRSHQLDQIYSQFNQSISSEHDQKTFNILPSNEEPIANIDFNHNQDQGISSSYELIAANYKKPLELEQSSSSFSCMRYVNKNGAYNVLAQKMKEMEMLDFSDVDQSLDVEEALHYYSRLTCPVYVDIVNKFFMDMYAEFLLPQRSISLRSSSRRLGPLTCLE